MVVVAVDSRSTQASRPARQLSVDHGMAIVPIWVAMTAFRSPAVQCAAENVIGPAHGYCTNVSGDAQLLHDVQLPPANPGRAAPVPPTASGLTDAKPAGPGHASAKLT